MWNVNNNKRFDDWNKPRGTAPYITLFVFFFYLTYRPIPYNKAIVSIHNYYRRGLRHRRFQSRVHNNYISTVAGVKVDSKYVVVDALPHRYVWNVNNEWVNLIIYKKLAIHIYTWDTEIESCNLLLNPIVGKKESENFKTTMKKCYFNLLFITYLVWILEFNFLYYMYIYSRYMNKIYLTIDTQTHNNLEVGKKNIDNR